jgi:tetratricopeptide (TPR) repeat protein
MIGKNSNAPFSLEKFKVTHLCPIALVLITSFGAHVSQSQELQKSERFPTNGEIKKIQQQTRLHINNWPNALDYYIKDNRNPQIKQQITQFQQTWQKVNPAVTPFLGLWGGYEQWVAIYPSTAQNQVCLISGSEEPGYEQFDTGTVEAGYLKTQGNGAFFREGSYLGIAAITGNRVQQGHETPLRAPYPLEKNSKFSQRLAASGCTEKLPHQAYKEMGDEYYDKQMWSKAIDVYNKAIKSSPRYTATIYNRGLAYYYNGQNELALSDLTKAAQLYQEQGKEKDRDDAIAFIRKIDPNYSLSEPGRQESRQTSVKTGFASLVNGNYRFCETKLAKDLGDGGCFSFRKKENHIVGDYTSGLGEDSFCFVGEVSNNYVQGKAIENYTGANNSLPPPGHNLNKSSNFLSLQKARIIKKYYERLNGAYFGIVEYENATIYLGKMHQWNAGQYIPPKTCSTSST